MKPSLSRNGAAGFTLMELMVTMAILTIILGMALQVTNSTRNSIRISEGKSVNDSYARKAFAQIGRDFSQIIARDDVRVELTSRSGNDKLAFLCNTRGLDASGAIGDRLVSLVTYELEQDPREGVVLRRGSNGHRFSDPATQSLNLNPAVQFSSVPTPNVQTLSRNVIRFEVEYLVQGTNGVTRENTFTGNSISNLKGVVITLATLDDRGRRSVGPSRIETLAGRFPDSASGRNTAEAWNRIRDDLARNGAAGLPKDALQSIRCYERTFLIP